MRIGAQLYTAHKQLTTLEDFDLGLEKVAKIGYSAVQVSGTCAYEPEWLRDALAKHNLVCPITHIDPDRLLQEAQKVAEEHRVFGCTHIGIGGMPARMNGSLEGYYQFRELFIPVALKLRDMGAKLMYHNHYWEFDKLDNKDVICRILEDFPEDALDFTLDLGWADFAGQNVMDLITMLKGRLSCVHLKDYADKPADSNIETNPYMRPIFEGKVDYQNLIPALKEAGTEYAFVEQDWCYDEDEFECLRRSYNNVTERFPYMK